MVAAKHLLRYLAGGTTDVTIYYVQARLFQANGVFGRKLGQQPEQRQVDILVPGLPGERSYQLQGETARSSSAIHDRGRSRSRSADHEGTPSLCTSSEIGIPACESGAWRCGTFPPGAGEGRPNQHALMQDETAEPVSRYQILRCERGQGNINFPCSPDHEQDWQPYPVDPSILSLYV